MCRIRVGKSHSYKGNVPSYELVPIIDEIWPRLSTNGTIGDSAVGKRRMNNLDIIRHQRDP